ncbi:hypothetical protein [Marinobacterium stanieri]|uniref:Conjugation TrbI-like protein n=1 Tax=Marinobacterium stanieri TaxID=49186 RepID=A0A1N6XAJ9_9GAMM|nr:hypothetical protein [Marinobacterium stanieri]SIQ99372.1 hypothetical protein SAMN05421647_11351 [Marinobacterium stanieri]
MSDAPVVDTSTQKKNFISGLFSLFSSATPHSGFNRLLLVFALVGAFSWYWWMSEDKQTASLGRTETSESASESTSLDTNTLDAGTRAEIAKHDAEAAGEAREKGENFAGARPAPEKTSTKDVLAGIRDRAKLKTDVVAVEDAAPAAPVDVPVFKLDLETASRASSPRVEDAKQNTVTTQPKQEKENPYLHAALEKTKKAKSQGSEFLNGTLVEFEPDEEEQLLAANNAPSGRTQPGLELGGSVQAEDQTAQVNEPVARQVLDPGHFVFGYSLTGVDTDVARNEVAAEIMGGELDGCRLLGTWQRLSNYNQELSLVFNTLSYGGQPVPVNLVAFNHQSKLPAFVDEVDRHILVRWGGLVTGSMLAALKTTATAAAVTNEEAAVAFSLSDDELKEVFVSSAGDKAAEKLIELFDRPITSRVFPHQEMQLLVMEPVSVPHSTRGCSSRNY